MSSILVTGAARGLGFGLIELLAFKPVSEVHLIFASARKPSDALVKLATANQGRVHLVDLEVADVTSVQNAAKKVEAIWGSIKNDLEETFRVNVIGTHIVTTEFLPLLKKGKGKKIINISSPVGSLTIAPHLTMFQTPAYKISKADLNMLTVQRANDFGKKGFSVFALSPGWVKTDMGTDNAELTVEQSVKEILQTVQQSDSTSNGKFLDINVEGWVPTRLNSYKGGEIPW